ncbi:MAG: transglutaminase domain-containing protein [Candidatus Binataceae bacterium]|nr:transglutaminase domain-containing protein [Candidatus Binataceae bacterium]
MPEIFHFVRRIPYGAAGQRDPRMVYENNVGSCSGKHILLRDLLRKVHFEAEVVTISTYFNQGVPAHESMPAELRRMIRSEEVLDFHHYVRAREAGGIWLKLDATWHDRLAGYGFPVNDRWNGAGDSHLAGAPIEEYPPVEDVGALKQELLGKLSVEERDLRSRFFLLLTGWIAGLEGTGRP